MKKKNYLLLSAIIATVGVSFYGFKNYALKVKDSHCFTTQISSKIFDFNTFQLNVDSNLNLLDFKVVNQNSGNVIFVNGKSKKGIQNDYGHRIFELYINNRKEYEMGHFISDNWVTNDYVLSLRNKDGLVNPDFQIHGKNAYFDDFFYKRFEYDKNGKLKRISFLNKDNEVYNVEIVSD